MTYPVVLYSGILHFWYSSLPVAEPCNHAKELDFENGILLGKNLPYLHHNSDISIVCLQRCQISSNEMHLNHQLAVVRIFPLFSHILLTSVLYWTKFDSIQVTLSSRSDNVGYRLANESYTGVISVSLVFLIFQMICLGLEVRITLWTILHIFLDVCACTFITWIILDGLSWNIFIYVFVFCRWDDSDNCLSEMLVLMNLDFIFIQFHTDCLRFFDVNTKRHHETTHELEGASQMILVPREIYCGYPIKQEEDDSTEDRHFG